MGKMKRRGLVKIQIKTFKAFRAKVLYEVVRGRVDTRRDVKMIFF